MLVTCQQMREAEEQAFRRGTSAAQLMDEAGAGIARVVRQFFPTPGRVVIYLGSGNNAGDALVAAGHLREAGWRVSARLAAEPEKLKDLPRSHWQKWPAAVRLTAPPPSLAVTPGPLVLLDGLLGTGAVGGMREEIRALAAEMNQCRHEFRAATVAMDIPSGLHGDTGAAALDAVVADVTATVGCVKLGLVSDAATAHVGRLCLVPLSVVEMPASGTNAALITPDLVRACLPRRCYEIHKGQAGRVGVLAGSRGFLGAAWLVCMGALRGGAGLVTLLAEEKVYPLLAASLPAEVMVKPVADFREALELNFDALAVGPGLGFDAEAEILTVLDSFPGPAVIDADALTMLARKGLASVCEMAGDRLLTPHPGEMARLVAGRTKWEGRSRRELAESVAEELPGHTILLKGARTVIASVGGRTLFNSTGHPGMATGGMGDVLTGVCAGLLGQGLSTYQAAAVGAWTCGRAAELAALDMAEEVVLPGDVLRNMGIAWKNLARTDF